MGGYARLWAEGDAVTRSVALLLLALSVSAWVVILWKGWGLLRVRRDLARAVPTFWSCPDLSTAQAQMHSLDREQVLSPLLAAALSTPAAGTLEAGGEIGSQLTRRLRDALHRVVAQLQYGQVLLASVGSTAPFVGLFGTVWGIYHALMGIGAAGQATIDKVAGPIGEALIMTALGLAVAIPAVLGYNALVRGNKHILARLNRFAHDLHAYLVTGARVHGGGAADGKVVPMKKA